LVVRVRAFRAVVGEEHEHRVIQLSGSAQVVDQAADVVVHGFRHAGIDLHVASGESLIRGVQRIPSGRRRRVPQSHRGRKHAQLGRAASTFGAHRLPAGRIAAAVAVAERGGCLHGQVVGLKTDIGEKRLRRLRRARRISQVTQQSVHEEL